jgi:hypothetical protein
VTNVRKPLGGMVLVAALVSAGCNQQTSLISTPVSPTPTTPLPAPGMSQTPLPPGRGPSDVANMSLERHGVIAGASIVATVDVFTDAPAGGTIITLSSSDPAASVPPAATVPAGQRTVDFIIATNASSGDRQPVITARGGSRTAIAVLSIFGRMPIFFWWDSDRGDVIGEGGWNRHYPGYSEMTAVCTSNEVRVEMDAQDPEIWTVRLKAPAGQPLAIGSYESASQIGSSGPHATMMVSGRHQSCREVSGRFVIHDLDLQNDRVHRLHASFEQQCLNTGTSGWLRGEVRIADMPPSGDGCLR